MDCLPHRAAAVTSAIIALSRGAARQPAPGRRLTTLELAARRPCRAPRTATFAASRKKWVRDAMAACGDRIAFTLIAHIVVEFTLRSSRSCRAGIVRLACIAPTVVARMRRDGNSAKISIHAPAVFSRTQHHAPLAVRGGKEHSLRFVQLRGKNGDSRVLRAAWSPVSAPVIGPHAQPSCAARAPPPPPCTTRHMPPSPHPPQSTGFYQRHPANSFSF